MANFRYLFCSVSASSLKPRSDSRYGGARTHAHTQVNVVGCAERMHVIGRTMPQERKVPTTLLRTTSLLVLLTVGKAATAAAVSSSAPPSLPPPRALLARHAHHGQSQLGLPQHGRPVCFEGSGEESCVELATVLSTPSQRALLNATCDPSSHFYFNWSVGPTKSNPDGVDPCDFAMCV